MSRHLTKLKFMRRYSNIAYLALALGLLAAAIGQSAAPKRPAEPPTGPFGLSMIRTADKAPADIDLFQATETCGVCHPRQLEELTGSMHLASHTDPLYRAMAELARKEAGPKVYAFCAGCHSPAGVLTGLIPAKPDGQLPAEAKAGVTCDVCHQISALTGATGPWKEPANASFTIQQGMVKFGNYGNVAENRSHSGEKKDFFGSFRVVRQLPHGHSADERVSYRVHVRRVEGGDLFAEGDSVPGLPHADRRRGPESGGDASAAGSHGKIRCRRRRIARSIGTTSLAAMPTPTSLPVERPTPKWPRRD